MVKGNKFNLREAGVLVGRFIRGFTSNFSQLALAFPGWFLRVIKSIIQRLFSDVTFIAIWVFGILWVLVVLPILFVLNILYNPLTNVDINTLFVDLYNTLVGLRSSDGAEYFWIILIIVVLLMILPKAVFLYIRLAIGLIKTMLFFVLYFFSGKRLGIFAANTAHAETTTQSSPEGSIEGKEVEIAYSKTDDASTITIEQQKPRSDTRLEPTKTRIKGLLRDLRAREDMNLGIGMLFSIIGVMGLVGIVFLSPDRLGDKAEFMLWFIPRLSVTLFIQLFAYFFLRLYKANLDEIRYFNNELTNIDCKTIALEIALERDNEGKLVSDVCIELSKVDRNLLGVSYESSQQDLFNQMMQVIRELNSTLKEK